MISPTTTKEDRRIHAWLQDVQPKADMTAAAALRLPGNQRARQVNWKRGNVMEPRMKVTVSVSTAKTSFHTGNMWKKKKLFVEVAKAGAKVSLLGTAQTKASAQSRVSLIWIKVRKTSNSQTR